MCTLSVVRTPRAWRVVCNRDESPMRMLAMPPTEVRVGDRRAVMPIDPQSGGTWLAANDAGLVLAILNKSEPDVPAAGRESRGLIIPLLMAASSAREALQAAIELDASRFRSFRLAIIDGLSVHVVVSDGANVSEAFALRETDAWCAASSGLGDGLVEPARVKLFDTMVVGAGDLIAAQDAFHRHRWADRPHMSVDMMRDGAQTVSVTAVTLTGETARMQYTDTMTGEQAFALLRLAGEQGRLGVQR